MKSIKKLLRTGALALGLFAVTLPAAYAQTTTTETEPQVVEAEPVVVDTNDGFDWGWLGLIGLLGLAGLAGRNRREPEPEVRAYDSTTKR